MDKPNISEGPLTTTVEDSTVSQNFKKKKSFIFTNFFKKSFSRIFSTRQLNVDSNISEKEISFEQVSEGSLESDTDGQDQIETDADDEVKDGEDDEEIEVIVHTFPFPV